MKKVLLPILLKTLLILASGFLLVTCIFPVHRAAGNTMSPFVRDGDLCIFIKMEKASLGDVVLYLNQENKLQIGRIAAVGGQTVDFQETGGYTVDNCQPLEEIPYETYSAEDAALTYPLTLSENEVFILNDFRSLTEDSRSCGPVNREQIRGKLFVLFRRRGF